MDTKDYLAKESYPLSTQSLDFIQNQILFVQKIGALLGEGAWLLKEATAEERGLVFVNQNGVCKLVALVVGSGFKYYWIERTIENETTTEVLMGANSYTSGPNQTLISSDGLKRPEDLWKVDIVHYNYNALNFILNKKTKLVTVWGFVFIPAGPSQSVELELALELAPNSGFPFFSIWNDNAGTNEVEILNLSSNKLKISGAGRHYINISYLAN